MLTNSRLAYHSHDHKRCVSAALTQAKTLCDDSHVRLTPIREAVLRTIWASHRPLGAYDIVDQMTLSAASGKRILAPTVYRCIEFLLEQGLIHRIATLNAYIGCPFPGSNHSDFFLICRKCGSAAECSADQLNIAVEKTAKRAHFKVESQHIEIAGLCPECQDKDQKGCQE
ncbi:MAG: transcriptional repressor [Porticoccus sp.]|nr:transcriptional repressor [Porticoccus sp.]MBQ0806669.1 transcriptional repressor [Porticoccus sp.]